MAYRVYAVVTGTKQGVFKSEDVRSKDHIPLVGFSYGVTSPYDPANGRSSGKRQHKPVVITKEWGVASPQFFAAAFSGETLKSVVIDFVALNAQGIEEIDHTVTLTNATIASVDDKYFLGGKDGPPIDSRELDQIALVFQKIEITSNIGKTTAIDNWELARV